MLGQKFHSDFGSSSLPLAELLFASTSCKIIQFGVDVGTPVQRSMPDVSSRTSHLNFWDRVLTEPGAHACVEASWPVASRVPQVLAPVLWPPGAGDFNWAISLALKFNLFSHDFEAVLLWM